MDKAALAVRADQWRQIVDECNRSSLCKTEWCRKNSIRFRSLMYWQKKFRDQALLTRASDIEDTSRLAAIAPLSGTAFVDVTERVLPRKPINANADELFTSEPAVSEIMIRTGSCQVYLHGSVSEESLRTVMKVLRDV